MDELQFLRELAEASRRVPSGIGDVRAAVWKRIENTGTGAAEEGVLCFAQERKLMWRLDVAAAFAIVAGSGMVYRLVSSLASDVYWSGAFYSFYNYF